MAEPFISQISAFGLGFTIRDWIICSGQILSIQQNQALFSLISNVYGGDGSNTFGVPNLTDKTVVHSGLGPGLSSRTIGTYYPYADALLFTSNLPAHSHGIAQKAQPKVGTTLTPSPNTVTAIPEGNFAGIKIQADWYASGQNFQDLGSDGSPPTGYAGGNQHLPTISPYQVVTYEMALFGTYPPHSN
ncbi:phage tail protein [Pseudovibrio exalbescens]|uniref:Phage tail collar domain-containing protein n=1 Tax=Pseudovibrio exalbescens TaxID=197461 RepID=A0A1U7JDR7_9HYPH|nr:tail fiber protein [Pseudovibrio exalbescens]OKL42883.1 hypothetical protein A3843_16435 [Pseudovibrio exalbescens]